MSIFQANEFSDLDTDHISFESAARYTDGVSIKARTSKSLTEKVKIPCIIIHSSITHGFKGFVWYLAFLKF